MFYLSIHTVWNGSDPILEKLEAYGQIFVNELVTGHLDLRSVAYLALEYYRQVVRYRKNIQDV